MLVSVGVSSSSIAAMKSCGWYSDSKLPFERRGRSLLFVTVRVLLVLSVKFCPRNGCSME